jgi:DNA-binding NarL/FixJ family response regulator
VQVSDFSEPPTSTVTARPIRVLLLKPHGVVVTGIMAALRASPTLSVIASSEDLSRVRRQLSRHQPEVVILDEALLDLASTLRVELPTAKQLVVVDRLDDSTLLSCVLAEVAGCVSRHRAPAELPAAVRRVHDGETLYPAATLARLLAQAPVAARPPPRVSSPLARREREILQLLAAGLTTQQVAARLGISTHTVRTHFKKIATKLATRSKLDAVIRALKAGWIDLPE